MYPIRYARPAERVLPGVQRQSAARWVPLGRRLREGPARSRPRVAHAAAWLYLCPLRRDDSIHSTPFSYALRKKRKRHKIATHKRKKRLRKNRHKKKGR